MVVKERRRGGGGQREGYTRLGSLGVLASEGVEETGRPPEGTPSFLSGNIVIKRLNEANGTSLKRNQASTCSRGEGEMGVGCGVEEVSAGWVGEFGRPRNRSVGCFKRGGANTGTHPIILGCFYPSL